MFFLLDFLTVMAGHSRLKDGVALKDGLASARLCPGHPRTFFFAATKDVDGRVKPGHDEK